MEGSSGNGERLCWSSREELSEAAAKVVVAKEEAGLVGLEGLAEAVASQVAAAAVVDSVGVPRNRDRRHTSARGYIAFRQSISSSNRSTDSDSRTSTETCLCRRASIVGSSDGH